MENQIGRSILLIDDDTSLLVTLRDFLRFENYKVVTAESGERGLQRLEEMTPDLIILDMSMPGMGGIGFLREITTADGKPKYPVLVLTARANMAEFFADVEVDGFIAKPCEPNDLLMEIGRIMFLRSRDEIVSAAAALAPTEKPRILLGDDDVVLSEKIAKAFAEQGFIVETATRGPEVVEKAIIGRPDLIVMKLVFAGMNGDAVVGLLAEMENTQGIPIVIYDDTNSDGAQQKVLATSSAVSCVVRDADPDELIGAARDALLG